VARFFSVNLTRATGARFGEVVVCAVGCLLGSALVAALFRVYPRKRYSANIRYVTIRERYVDARNRAESGREQFRRSRLRGDPEQNASRAKEFHWADTVISRYRIRNGRLRPTRKIFKIRCAIIAQVAQ